MVVFFFLFIIFNGLCNSDFFINFYIFEVVVSRSLEDGLLLVYEFRYVLYNLVFIVRELLLVYEILVYNGLNLLGVFLEEVFLLFEKVFIFEDILNGLLEVEGYVN